MRIVWLTDCHFHLNTPSMKRPFQQYVEKVATEEPDILLLGGDLCDHNSLDRLLGGFSKATKSPTYFVLGNHEFLNSSVADVRAQAAEYSHRHQNVEWLSGLDEPVRLSEDIALIGYDTWGDCRQGDLSAHNIRRRAHQLLYDEIVDIQRIRTAAGNDTVRIAQAIISFLNQRGDEAATHLEHVGRKAARWARQIVVLTHAPLFPEATLYGKRNEPDLKGLPFFCCDSAGQSVRRLTKDFPDVEFIALSGHTHHEARVSISPNLRVHVHDPVFKDIESRWVVLEL